MRKIKGVVLIVVLLSLYILLHLDVGYVQGGSTIVDKDITEDTPWYLSGSPYILVKDIKVYSDAMLTIEPGVVVKFVDGAELYIAGGLRAQGNVLFPITFTSNSTTPVPGIWDGMIFDGVKGFFMDYALIEYATTGIELVKETNISNSIISNCDLGIEGKLKNASKITVTNNVGDGLSLSSSQIFVENSNISSNGGHGILVTSGSTLNLNYCIVSSNTKDGVILSSGGTIENSLINDNIGNGTCILGPTTIKNTTISDNSGDGIWTESSISITQCNITGNEKHGIRCDQIDGLIIIQNSSLSYNIGDGIWTNSSIEIDRCDINFNEGNGVIAENDGDMTVSWSNIRNNTLNGLTGRGFVSKSNVSGNKLCGILGNFTVESYSNITWNTGGGFNGTGSIYWCSIFSNTPYDAVADIWPNNITATFNWWGTEDGALIEEHIYHHNDTESLGYVIYDHWLSGPPQPFDNVAPKIANVTKKGTSPEPYVLDFPEIRMNEPVIVSANVIDNESPIPSGVDKVFLSYKVDGGQWRNTTMTYNATSGKWVATIPAQPGNSIVGYFIQAYDKNGNHNASLIYSFIVKELPIGDLNGDCSVDMADISIAIDHFMEYDY